MASGITREAMLALGLVVLMLSLIHISEPTRLLSLWFGVVGF